jgi:hypothetical protein
MHDKCQGIAPKLQTAGSATAEIVLSGGPTYSMKPPTAINAKPETIRNGENRKAQINRFTSTPSSP